MSCTRVTERLGRKRRKKRNVSEESEEEVRGECRGVRRPRVKI